jgi:hypothetical protein
MLTTTSFFVKACFHKSFIIHDLRSLTEGVQAAIFRLKGFITCFFENEEGAGTGVPRPFLSKAKASTRAKQPRPRGFRLTSNRKLFYSIMLLEKAEFSNSQLGLFCDQNYPYAGLLAFDFKKGPS